MKKSSSKRVIRYLGSARLVERDSPRYIAFMTFRIDADSFAAQARDLVVRTALKRSIRLVITADRDIPALPDSPLIVFHRVATGRDVADDAIVDESEENDLAFTRDIPLAERLVAKNLVVLNDRGDKFTRDNIRERVSLRDFSLASRLSGAATASRRKTYDKRAFAAFAAALDKELARFIKRQQGL